MKKLFLYFSILSIILSCNREAFYNDGEIEHEYSYSSFQYLLMNWGRDGLNNKVKCWFSNNNWPTTNNSFPYNPIIIYNFRQEDE